MPSPRRVRLLCAALLAGAVITMLWTSHASRGSVPPIPAAAPAPPPPSRAGDGAAGAAAEGTREMAGRLKEAEQKAKDLANSKAPLKPDAPSEVVGVGSAAGGREDDVGGETDEQHEAEQELLTILKRAPVIIFSKTFCPYSKRAKAILLEKYTVDPPPHIVELDLHPHGAELQALLGEKTGRATVPNVMVNGVSIGGGDEVNALHVNGELEARVEDLGEARKVLVSAKGD